MAWKMYRVTFCLLSPLHVGWFKQGNVQRTRPYVTGKTLWGALTARLTREGDSSDYQGLGKRVNEFLAFSYFYPSTEPDCVTLWPWDDPAEFAWRYLNTYASTALDYRRNSAEEGSLHETEYIAPYTREGEPVYLVGYIFEKEGCRLAWKEVLPRLQLGGERTYGWGRVGLAKEVALDTSPLFGRCQLELSGEWPRLYLDEDSPLLAHALAVEPQAVAAKGPLALLVGRETRNADRHGGDLSEARICWEPGAVATEKQPVRIGEHGLWFRA